MLCLGGSRLRKWHSEQLPSRQAGLRFCLRSYQREVTRSPELSYNCTSFDHTSCSFSSKSDMPSSHSSPGSQHSAHRAGIHLPSRKPSPSTSSADSRPSSLRSGPRAKRATLDSFLTDIGQFVQVLEEVVSLQVSTQEERSALIQSRQRAWEADEALAKAIRQSREEDVVLDHDQLLSLFDTCQLARDQLGPLEDSFQRADLQLVPREHELIRRGGKLRSHYDGLPTFFSAKKSPVQSSISQQKIMTPLAQNQRSATDRQDMLDLETALLLEKGSSRKRRPSRPAHHSFDSSQDSRDGPEKNGRISSIKPLLQEVAPDLVPEPPWSHWTQFASIPDDAPFSPYVTERDMPETHYLTTDIAKRHDGLLLGNTVPLLGPCLKDLMNVESSSDLVNIWLLYGLRTSRLEILRLQEEIANRASNGCEWSDILHFWHIDGTAVPGRLTGSLESNPRHRQEVPWQNLDLPLTESLSGKTLSWISAEESFLKELRDNEGLSTLL